jgi:hypothetical protein
MQTSESIKNLAAGLLEFHKQVGKISKDATNPFFSSTYSSLSNILDAISAPLQNSGLSLVQFPEGENGLTTRLVHVSGEWMESNYVMKPVKDTPQDRGSAITYQRRYAIGAILSLNICEDDDANAATHGYSNPQQAATQIANKVENKNGNANGNGADNKPWLNKWTDKARIAETPEWGRVLTALSEGKATVADVEKKYKVSKDLKEELKAFEKK